MAIYREYKMGSTTRSPLGFFGPLITLIIIFTALFFIAKGIFWVLTWVSPILLIITLVLDYTVVTGFFKYLWKLLRENPLIGILSCVLTFFGFPFVSAYLFFKAWARKSIHKKVSEFQKRNEEFSEYEEVKEDDFLVLPKLDKQSNSGNTPSHSSYDELFK